MKAAPHRDTFTFPGTPAGEELRTHLAKSLTHCGVAFELGEEDLTHGALTFHVLTLVKTGKRPGEGQIAARMKESKAHD